MLGNAAMPSVLRGLAGFVGPADRRVPPRGIGLDDVAGHHNRDQALENRLSFFPGIDLLSPRRLLEVGKAELRCNGRERLADKIVSLLDRRNGKAATSCERQGR